MNSSLLNLCADYYSLKRVFPGKNNYLGKEKSKSRELMRIPFDQANHTDLFYKFAYLLQRGSLFDDDSNVSAAGNLPINFKTKFRSNGFHG